MKNDYRHNKDGSTTIFLNSPKYGTKEVLIDTDDFEKVNEYPRTWALRFDNNGNGSKNTRFYVQQLIPHPDGSWVMIGKTGNRRKRITTTAIHHAIMGKPAKGYVIDHINGNGLDNRKTNLRCVSYSENIQNRQSERSHHGPSPKTGLTYRGVCVSNSKTRPYRATIGRGAKYENLGSFMTEEEAAQAYDLARMERIEIVNPERQLNFPEKLEEYKKALLAPKAPKKKKLRGPPLSFCLKNKDNTENILTNEALMFIIRVNSLRYAGLTWKGVAVQLNEMGIKTTKGMAWKKNYVRQITLVLRNEFDLTWPPDSPYSSMGD